MKYIYVHDLFSISNNFLSIDPSLSSLIVGLYKYFNIQGSNTLLYILFEPLGVPSDSFNLKILCAHFLSTVEFFFACIFKRICVYKSCNLKILKNISIIISSHFFKNTFSINFYVFSVQLCLYGTRLCEKLADTLIYWLSSYTKYTVIL